MDSHKAHRHKSSFATELGTGTCPLSNVNYKSIGGGDADAADAAGDAANAAAAAATRMS